MPHGAPRGLLTPENRRVFLYDRAVYDRDIDLILAAAGEPVARAAFDLYLYQNHLLYHKEPCRRADTADTFLLHLTAADRSDLPPSRRQLGFANRDFHFADFSLRTGESCVAMTPLPDYPLTVIRTGQYNPMQDELWQVEFPVR